MQALGKSALNTHPSQWTFEKVLEFSNSITATDTKPLHVSSN